MPPRQLTLNRPQEAPLTVLWEPEGGALSGPDASRLGALLRIVPDPAELTPTGPVVACGEPLTNPAQFAVALAWLGFRLPADLAALHTAQLQATDPEADY